MSAMATIINDGGRAERDTKEPRVTVCAERKRIATGMPYQEVYDELNEWGGQERISKHRKSKSSARTGVHKPTITK